jgi:DNA-binding MarR family transcriptional regulator
MKTAAPSWIVLNGIRVIVQSLREASRAAEARFGLSAAQLFVLQTLAGERAMSENELAARTYTHQSSVSGVVKKLVRRKLVRARRSPQDGRRLELSLTDAGAKVVRQAPDAAQAKLIQGLNSLSLAEQRLLSRGMRRLIQAMGMEGKQPAMFMEERKR